MPYRIAGIDVHKKILAVVVSDVEIESEYQFEGRMFGSNPEQLRSLAAWLARARGRRSSHGIDGSILETSVGSAGKVLEADTREARRCKAEVRNFAPGAGGVQSRTTGTQEGFPRCRTPGEAAGVPGIDSELCARCRATFVADGDTQEVPVNA